MNASTEFSLCGYIWLIKIRAILIVCSKNGHTNNIEHRTDNLHTTLSEYVCVYHLRAKHFRIVQAPVHRQLGTFSLPHNPINRNQRLA